MKILPIEKLTLVTNLSKVEVVAALKSNVGLKQNFGLWDQKVENERKFEGVVYDDHFVIKRIIHYRNSFLPEIKGKIIEKLSGTEIEMVLKPVSFVIVFMILWLSFVSVLFIATLIGVIFGKASITVCIIPTVMLCIGIGMLAFGFSAESEKAKKEIIEILQAKIKNTL